MADETKVCSKCGETKPLTEFNRSASNSDGLSGQCKVCRAKYRADNAEAISERMRRYQTDNAEALAEYKRQYYADNAEANKGQRREYKLLRKYGITLADYDALLAGQGNACAICGKTPEENGRRLAVDHDHATGEVRGLLCGSCNRGLGCFQDSATLTAAATLYLEVNK